VDVLPAGFDVVSSVVATTRPGGRFNGDPAVSVATVVVRAQIEAESDLPRVVAVFSRSSVGFLVSKAVGQGT
jgi:hypothetical protein